MKSTLSYFSAVLVAAASLGAWAGPGPENEPVSNVPERAVTAGEQRMGSRRPLSPETEVMPARFRATVFELQGSHANTLGSDTLARQAATSESLLNALSGVAKARVLYQIDQAVNVVSEQIVVGCSEPVKLFTNKDPDEPAVNGVTYINVGLILRLSAQLPHRGGDSVKPDVSLQTRLSTLGLGQTVPSSKSTAIRTATLNEIEPLEFGQPRILVGTNSNPATARTQPVTYVVRYVFDGIPQSSDVSLVTNPKPGSGQPSNRAERGKVEFGSQFEATAYEVRIPPQQITVLDSDALAHEAGTAETLLGSLTRIGEAKITSSINQVVNVLSDQVTVSTNEWLNTGVRTRSGLKGPREEVFSRTSQRVGLSVRFAGTWPTNAAAGPNVTFQIQSSGLGESGTPPTADVKANRRYIRSITHSEPLEFDKPRVLLSVASPGEPGEPGLATVFRYRFSLPPTPKTPGSGPFDTKHALDGQGTKE